MTEDCVYAVDMKIKKQKPTHINQVNTIKDNLIQNSKRQRERAKIALEWNAFYK